MVSKLNAKRLSSTELKNQLWDTIMLVKSGKMEPDQAYSVARAANALLSVTKMELQISTLMNRRPNKELQRFANTGDGDLKDVTTERTRLP